ncbi:hypothetical protein E0493_08095 [Roseomonas sp. M0104]|uniref:Uncharacterized protein n=1 Tax=Teichococcus coralli TaxID=2545983 RepID=A0A845B818_9PROT|nr:hypothetical protein [Pseudoroseomonas coralli]MXP63311.1 hypothetical protein [Pseudoroseomonas coralli]
MAGTDHRADKLRHDIDSGRSGDKVAFSDPAAAPLGADDEAAGVPPSPEMIARARALETGSAPAAAQGLARGASEAEARGSADRSRTGWMILAVLAGVVVLVAIALAIG